MLVRVILILLLVVLILRALMRLFRGVLEGAGYRREGAPGPPGVNLVRDPVCGIFVVPSKALTSGAGEQTRYFCSEKCRREWSRR